MASSGGCASMYSPRVQHKPAIAVCSPQKLALVQISSRLLSQVPSEHFTYIIYEASVFEPILR